MKSHQISEKIEFYAVINEFLCVTGSLVMGIDGSPVPVRSVSISHIASGQSKWIPNARMAQQLSLYNFQLNWNKGYFSAIIHEIL